MTTPVLPQEAKPGLSNKAIAGWTAGMLVFLGLAWFTGAVVVPMWRFRNEIAELGVEDKLPFGLEYSAGCTRGEPYSRAAWLVERTGGAERTARRLEQYLNMPRALAPNRATAVYLLGFCEGHALGALLELLESEDPKIRACSIGSLATIGPDARAAAPRLKEFLEDEQGPARERIREAISRVDREPEEDYGRGLLAIYGVDEDSAQPVEKDLSKCFDRYIHGYLVGELQVQQSGAGSSNYVIQEAGKKDGWGCAAYLSGEQLGKIKEGTVYKFYGKVVGSGHKGYIRALVVYEVRKP